MDILKFVWLCGGPLLFFISFLLLIMFWGTDEVRLVGLYAILPGINMAVINLASSLIDFDQAVLISAIVDFVFILPIVFLFRTLYRNGFLIPWFLLAFETFRSVLLILYLLDSRPKLTYFEAALFYYYFLVPFTLMVYCIITRNRSKVARQTSVSR